ncbi:MAG TPA: cell division protein CrgA [Acidimicrobiales bacterium]|nr:cell division protein CrgA [Acidimicrobiales bacterium]
MAKSTPKSGNRKTVGRYVAPEARGKVTARRPVSDDHSPRWYGWLIVALLGLGMLIVILNYLAVLPGSVSSWYLVGGLAVMFAGFYLATRYK